VTGAGVAALTVAVALAASPVRAAGQAAGDGRLEVTVTYKGAGVVKPTNAIAVFAFGSPTIDDSSEPIGVQRLEKNGGTVTFTGLSSPTVYLAVTFDEKGTYAAQGAPPAGTPYTIYNAKARGAPATPIAIGKGARVSITFDASKRW
jgi:hypothetical protein